VIAWRAANRGEELPRLAVKPGEEPYIPVKAPVWNTVVDQMYSLAKGDEEWKQAEKVAKEAGLTPLRFVLSGNNAPILYCAPKPEELDNRLFPHAYVNTLWLVRRKSGLKEYTRKWRLLPSSTAKETTIHEWPEAAEWAGKQAPMTWEQKQEAMKLVEDFDPESHLLLKDSLTEEEYDKIVQAWSVMRHNLLDSSRYVQDVAFYLPIGLQHVIKADDATRNEVRYIALGYENVALRLAEIAPESRKSMLIQEYVRPFLHKETARKRIVPDPDKGEFSLVSLPLNAFKEMPSFGMMPKDKADGMKHGIKLSELNETLTAYVQNSYDNRKYYGTTHRNFYFPKGMVPVDDIRTKWEQETEAERQRYLLERRKMGLDD
jgi:hypothetical protein